MESCSQHGGGGSSLPSASPNPISYTPHTAFSRASKTPTSAPLPSPHPAQEIWSLCLCKGYPGSFMPSLRSRCTRGCCPTLWAAAPSHGHPHVLCSKSREISTGRASEARHLSRVEPCPVRHTDHKTPVPFRDSHGPLTTSQTSVPFRPANPWVGLCPRGGPLWARPHGPSSLCLQGEAVPPNTHLPYTTAKDSTCSWIFWGRRPLSARRFWPPPS